MKPRVAFLALMFSLPVFAEQDLTACADDLSDCHDTCSLRFGTSTKDSDRLKLSKCLAACQTSEQTCRDRTLETHVHPLEEGSLKNADKHDDDLREDNRKKAIIEDEKPTTAGQTKPKKQQGADLDPKPEAKAEPKPEPKPEARAEAKPEPQKEPGLDKSGRNEGEQPRAAERHDPPTMAQKRKALDEWDPEAR